MGFSPELLNQWRTGLWLLGPESEMPEGSFRLARNARIDRILGIPTSRPGVGQLTTAAVDAAFLQGIWLSKLYGSAADFSYAQESDGATSRLYRLNDAWADASKTLLASPASVVAVSDVNWVDGAVTPGIWKYLVGPIQRKDNGTVFQNFGIASPTQAPNSAVLGARLEQGINSFESFTQWTGTNIGGQADEPTIRQQGTFSQRFTVAANTLGSVGIAFAGTLARLNGTYIGPDNNPSLIQTAVDFLSAFPHILGAMVRNTTDGSEGRVTRVGTTTTANDTLFFDGGLSGGTENLFDFGDAFEIYYQLDTFNGIATGNIGTRIFSTVGDQTSSTIFTDNSGVANKTNRTVVTTVNFLNLGVRPGMTIWNLANGCQATVTGVGQTTNAGDTIFFTTPTGSTENDWDNGDTFFILNDLVKDDDYIRLWFRTDLPDRVEFVQVDFDLDTTTLANAFANNYYSVRVPGSALNQGRDTWTELFLRKSEFTRAGTDTNKDWRAVRACRISVKTTSEGAISVLLDQLSWVGGYGLEGEYEITVIYRNSVTGCRSNPPLLATEPTRVVASTKLTQSTSDGTLVETKRHPIPLDLTSLASPSDSQIDEMRLYIKGGTLPVDPETGSPWRLLDTIPDTRTSYTILKSEIEIATNETLEEDNDLIPSNAVVLFGPGGHNRLFCIYDRNKIGFTKPWQRGESRGENWPRDFFFLVGDGSSEALNGIVQESQILVYTEDSAYEVIGRGDAYQAVPIPGSHGLAARFALDYGDGRIFFLARDGIYQQVGLQRTKLTTAIDPFFQGQTINGITPISQANMTTCRLKHYASPQGGMVVLLYPEEGQSTPNRRLILKKNPFTGQYSDVFLDDTTGVNSRALYVDYEENQLLAAGDNSRVYRLERDDLNADDGVAIEWQIQTKGHHQRFPRHEKSYASAVVVGNTGDVAVTVQGRYNNGADTEALGTVDTTTDGAQTHFTVTNTATKRNIALRLTASTTAQIRIFQLGWEYTVEAEDLAFWDTDEISLPTRHVLRHLLCDVDSAVAVTATAYLDGTAAPTETIALTSGRQRVDLLFSDDALRRGRNLRATFSGASPFQLYGVTALLEPEPLQTAYWDSRLIPFPTRRVLRHLFFDGDFPAAVTVSLFLDGSATAAETQTLTATTARTRTDMLFSNVTIRRGRAFRITLSSASQFQVWSLDGAFETEPLQTIFHDTRTIAFPTRRVLRHLLFDGDFPASVTVSLYLDGSTTAAETQTLTATTARARSDLLFSDVTLRRGTAFRITLSSASQFQLWGLDGAFEVEPLQTRFWDSGEIPQMFVSHLKRLEFDLDAPANVTVTAYLDGTAQTARTLSATTNRQRAHLLLPAGWRAKSFKVRLSSTSALQVWGLWGWTKAVGKMVGYAQSTFVSQTNQPTTHSFVTTSAQLASHSFIAVPTQLVERVLPLSLVQAA